jgi:hypothetical protein
MNAGMNITVNDVIALYERLRARGQTSIMARISVESRLTHLPSQERREAHHLLLEAETNKK